MTITSNASNALGIYIHIPFCIQKCGYCDFLSFTGSSRGDRKRYVDGLLEEILYWGGEHDELADSLRGRPVDTIFIGGGTPSLLEASEIDRLLGALARNFKLNTATEITIEANPGTINREQTASYRSAGVNRLSLGAQSFYANELMILGRVHSAADVRQAVADSRAAGFDNINLDLMFGIPGQSLKTWGDTLEQAFSLQPEHLSFYSLEIEDGTPFGAAFATGQLQAPCPETERQMYYEARWRLESNGFEVYEISNAARSGRQCRHNLKYWTMQEYLGIGLGAHSYIGRNRLVNPTEMSAYLAMVEQPDAVGEAMTAVRGSPATDKKTQDYRMRQPNTEADDQSDYLFTGLRLTRGLERAHFHNRYSVYPEDIWGAGIRRQLALGRLEYDADRSCLRLTMKGRDLMNQVLLDLFDS
ncbi:MAG TPA: radical SAM family heme chaperone HemW [Clostridiales bacterium]|jgi:oxygen-independent coproporphyrinogen-3 oxidase|nr:radical SAM family heme chaperone HemW [Clostridiales bacterium]